MGKKMSKEIALEVKNVSKHFKLPIEQANGLKQAVINRAKGVKGYKKQEVLKDISFTVEKGDFFGIVGRNGSGKSTLLKLISGIYEPDGGSININGSLVPFIELGVGFNPELTGRENVYLNGALLGFSTKDVDKMYDEIVEFAELHDFMDQKLKNYSSGMQVRLAFSCAIRANTDILVLDEILAVGDEAFQRKCNLFFESIKKDKNKTIILVTHSMDSVNRYCNKAIMIRDGEIIIDGSPEDVANQYIEDNFNNKNKEDLTLGLSNIIPELKIVPVSSQILKNIDSCEFEVIFKKTNKMPVKINIRITDETSGALIYTDLSKSITNIGISNIKYHFPITIYNNIGLVIRATVQDNNDEIIAFTSEQAACRFRISNSKNKHKGIIKPSSKNKGTWL